MTPFEQHQRHKEKRRFKKLEDLAKRLNLKCQRSRRSLSIIDNVLEKIAKENVSITQYLDAIRRAN